MLLNGMQFCIKYTVNVKIQKSRNLLNERDSLLEIHAEVDELPLDAFLLVLLLLEHKHVVVEELLQTLVRVVDAQLLERVVLSTYPYQAFNVLYCQHIHIKPLTCCTVNKYISNL